MLPQQLCFYAKDSYHYDSFWDFKIFNYCLTVLVTDV